jgi:peptide/nickel transport system ATP-binding protein
MKSDKFLSIRNLTIEYATEDETVYAVNDVSLDLEKGKTLGLVGETGAGKTTIARSILRILQVPPAVVKNGEIWLDGVNILSLSEEEMYQYRGNKISMIFQDPMTALNPVISIGNQIAEVIRKHDNINKAQARKRAEEMLELVGIPAERYGEYPHQFSGGMKQRVVIAIALSCNPDLLLADEPTTALDVTIQAQMLDLMRKLHSLKETSTIMITHDMGIVAEMCDYVAIIYAGRIVEYGSLEDVFDHAVHPYTVALFEAIPSLEEDVERLNPIQGLPPDPTSLPQGCSFAPRCKYATEQCKQGEITMQEITPGHYCRCCRAGKEENRA